MIRYLLIFFLLLPPTLSFSYSSVQEKLDAAKREAGRLEQRRIEERKEAQHLEDNTYENQRVERKIIERNLQDLERTRNYQH
jgi:hypothetical protein